MTVVAVIAPGAMGAGVAQVLVSHGTEVRTLLDGRSAATVKRAEAAGMRGVDLAGIAGSDVVLSIVPPGEALALAERLRPALARGKPGLIYADCNAVSPQTVQSLAAILADTGIRFVDVGIIGLPPKPDGKSPVFYACGEHASALADLVGHEITVKPLSGPIGAASGLKMSYAGITKGLTGLAAAMMLAATRFGAAPDLAAELATSQPHLLAWLSRQMPNMYSKAYRWVAEMEEVAAFASGSAGADQIYEGLAALYGAIAADQAGPKQDVQALDAFLAYK